MKLTLLWMIVILLPMAYAGVENYNNYSTFIIDINVSSFVEPAAVGNNAKLNILNISVFVYPSENYMQKIIGEKHTISSNGRLIKRPNAINIVWINTGIKKYEFSSNYAIRTSNGFIKIDKKINFPINEIDKSLVEYIMFTDSIDANDEIKKKAAELAEGKDDYYDVVFSIAGWVNQNINYSLTTLTADVVEKSSWVMEQKYGVCDEITNLFISMLRSLGIPARFVTGVAYTNIASSFGNHGWAEVYFPGYGWVPFDVTYGQYGWLDVTHVKFFDSVDSENPSVEYMWKSINTEMRSHELIIDAKAVSMGGLQKRIVDFEIRPLINDVNFGSYVPVELRVKNLEPYYVAMNFRLSKALSGRNLLEYNEFPSKSILLGPKEERTLYWILQTPMMIDRNYVYTSEIEVLDNFNYAASTNVKYGRVYDSYDLDYAKNLTASLKMESKKELLADIDLNCSLPRDYVYSDENALVYCRISNIGNKNLDGMDICMIGSCIKTSLLLGESKMIIISNVFKNSGDVVAVAKYMDKARASRFYVDVVKRPVLSLKKESINEIKYAEWRDIGIEIITNTKINNITVKVGKNEFNVDELDGVYRLILPVKGKMFYDDQLNIEIKYKDGVGKYYFFNDELAADVAGVPWYIRIFDIF